MIEISALKKSYGSRTVLDGVNLSIPEGEVTVLIGRSGCGKSTLLRCINFLETFEEGEIHLNGEPLWYDTTSGRRRPQQAKLIARERQKMGIVFQQYNLFPHMTALENVALGPIEAQGVARADALAYSRKMLDRVGLAGRESSYPSQMSGGQQQRVAIARALAMKGRILLLDEPTSALDPELVAEVEDVIKDLRRDRITMVLVTHSMALAREVADHVVYLDKGEILARGSANEVLENPTQPSLQDFLRRTR